ncbi:MAG: hypothetical protein RLZZ366_1197 [Pseudomonadota bacterium]|jgi:DNA-binding MarR family transcriptional regulator
MIDPLAKLPGYVLRRATSATSAELRQRLAPLDLRMTDVSILLLIQANPGVTQSELGRMLDIKRANMTPIAAKLAERDLIARQQVDGRSHGWALTAAGVTLMAQAQKIISTFERALVERVPTEHRAHILPVLMALWSPA